MLFHYAVAATNDNWLHDTLLQILIAGMDVFSFPLILTLLFDVALVGLLAHPMSREYQRIWFK